MIRHARLAASSLVVLGSCLCALAQSEPTALPVLPVASEPPPAETRPAPQVQAPPLITPAALDELKARVSKIEAENTKLKSDLAAARAELKTAKTQSATTASKLSDEREDLTSQITQLTAEKARAEAARDQARVDLASARARLEVYENSIREGAPIDAAALQEALNQSQKRVDMTVRAFAVIEQENNRIHSQFRDMDPDRAASDLQRQERELQDLRRDLDAEKTRSANLARELARARPGLGLVIDESVKPTSPTSPNSAAAVAAATPPAEMKTHTVADGENLSLISKRYYNTPNRWMEIYNANRDVLPNEHSLAPGMKLRIP